MLFCRIRGLKFIGFRVAKDPKTDVTLSNALKAARDCVPHAAHGGLRFSSKI